MDIWCKRWMLEGTLFDCTPKWVADQITAEEGRATSHGRVAAIFAHWREIGYADIAEDPVRFIGLTPAGVTLGYEELYRRAGIDRRVSGHHFDRE